MAVKSKKSEKATTAKKRPGVTVYLGPNIPGVIQTSTIYPASLEEALALPELRLALEKEPGIKQLLVDGSTLPQDMIKVKTPGEQLFVAYRKLLKN